jgi:SAM-dependent methyltransferase
VILKKELSINVFADYARYYDLLYKDKDYTSESVFVLEILKKHGCTPRTLLDLGCGTGRHAMEMTKQGVHVIGVDMSESMLKIGRAMLEGLNPPDFSVPLPELLQCDVRAMCLDKKFDAVVSLFHVMSYQNIEEDALAVMQTAREHLNPGGLFLFDFWYGPGVLTNPPAEREKIIEDDVIKVVRKAIPKHRINANVVEVHYNILVIEKKTGNEYSFNECHLMRYWFLLELRYLVKQIGFRVIDSGGWLKDVSPDLNDYNAWVLCQ